MANIKDNIVNYMSKVYTRGSAAPTYETLIGGAVGGFAGDQLENNPQSIKGMLIGGALGGIGAPHIGAPLRRNAIKNLYGEAQKVVSARNTTQQKAQQTLRRIREQVGRGIGVDASVGNGTLRSDREILDFAVLPHLNTRMSSAHQRQELSSLYNQAKSEIINLPFGIGAGAKTNRFTTAAQPYTKPYYESGLKMKEDLSNLGRGERKYIMDAFRKGPNNWEQTDAVVNRLIKRYKVD